MFSCTPPSDRRDNATAQRTPLNFRSSASPPDINFAPTPVYIINSVCIAKKVRPCGKAPKQFLHRANTQMDAGR